MKGTTCCAIEYRTPSCGKCIATNFSRTTVQRGEMRNVVVQYRTAKDVEEFSEYVELWTNDEQRPRPEVEHYG